MSGLLDALGYLIMAGMLFLPVAWFVAYAAIEVVRYMAQSDRAREGGFELIAPNVYPLKQKQKSEGAEKVGKKAA